jgi:RNA polymerase sigma-70 factor (ECF subfamily)
MQPMTNDTWRSRRADLRRFVSKRVSDHHEAEDIVQDVLVRAHESLHSLESTDRLSAWLARIAANRIIDHYRSRRPTEELPKDLVAAQPEEDPVVTLAPCLPAMVERLPETYRDAVRLSELEGVPQREVARRLGISLSGAKSRVQRGRTLLRELVEACCRVFMTGTTIVGFERIAGNAGCSKNARCSRMRLS